jgi:hypothetical protein
VTRAIRALSRALRLRAPVQGNLKLPRSCAKIWPPSGECTEYRTEDVCWGTLPQPVPEDFYGDVRCAPGPRTSMTWRN